VPVAPAADAVFDGPAGLRFGMALGSRLAGGTLDGDVVGVLWMVGTAGTVAVVDGVVVEGVVVVGAVVGAVSGFWSALPLLGA
jgi:hypothetical protein